MGRTTSSSGSSTTRTATSASCSSAPARSSASGSSITGCVGVVADVTADREAEQALQEQTDRYRLLLELSPDGIVVHEDGLIRWANQAAAEFVGVDDLNDYLGESLTQFIHPDSLLETLERIASLKEDEAATKPAEATLVRLDGSNIVVESLSVRTKWDGRPAYQVILRDLSLRKKAEETHALPGQAGRARLGRDHRTRRRRPDRQLEPGRRADVRLDL